ncbi:uncharacterized protein LAESUDRAFT_167884 [Laetiporus sulphureus 93-53]|uniref:Uncharacterized protein n=1 Tax=Laetiporus sulphureus 93-53 TaxID=1314785 RepID=A0A165HSR9_9APHY|nr:uncharacterized protein LAESUDRAFT_167884 [Laetiporus sulphureus 93-53]KZT12136.1 hypothetical protein LAESUDRAFT_167884 [Laetiporus sulphureus 93-53]
MACGRLHDQDGMRGCSVQTCGRSLAQTCCPAWMDHEPGIVCRVTRADRRPVYRSRSDSGASFNVKATKATRVCESGGLPVVVVIRTGEDAVEFICRTAIPVQCQSTYLTILVEAELTEVLENLSQCRRWKYFSMSRHSCSLGGTSEPQMMWQRRRRE